MRSSLPAGANPSASPSPPPSFRFCLPLIGAEWPGSGTMFRACLAPGTAAPSATGIGMERPCPRGASRPHSSRPKRSGPAPWPCTTPSPSGRTASPSTAPSSSSGRTTWSGSMRRRSPSGHILCAAGYVCESCVMKVCYVNTVFFTLLRNMSADSSMTMLIFCLFSRVLCFRIDSVKEKVNVQFNLTCNSQENSAPWTAH